jgi:serine O-acetyltransferase
MEKDIKKRIADSARKLGANYQEQGIFEVSVGEKLPKRSEIIEIVNEVRRLVFPGFFGVENTAYVSLEAFAGSTLAVVYEKLFKQIRVALLYDRRKGRQKEQDTEYNNETSIEELAESYAMTFIDKLPEIQNMVLKDVQAELDGDPAAGSREEVIFCYPGLYTIFVYRIAHELYKLHIPYIPRIMSEHAHGKTGIDINPGAEIGEYFFIDHGTGIVIGETTIIGNHVKIYQGVTLGALSTMKGQELSGVKRHPTIEDNVVIYANTTILGGETIVGANSVVAGNSFITSSIPANTRVSMSKPELKLRERRVPKK